MLKLKKVMASIDPEKEVLFYDAERNIWVLIDEESHVKKIYKVVTGYWLEEVEVDYKGMAERISEKVNIAALVEERLKTISVGEILEVQERLEKPDASIEDGPGCYEISIGGKVGAPMRLVLIDP